MPIASIPSRHTGVPGTRKETFLSRRYKLQMATDYRPGALSPRLRTFYWTSARHHSPSANYPVGFFDPFTSLFIGESVEALDVIGTRDDPLYVGSLTLATRRLPRLKQLWMSSHMTGIPFVLWFMTSFPWDFLEEVCLDRVSAKVISALARMPCLRKLRLLDLETMYLAPLAEGSHVEAAPLTDFASLRMLNITSWNLVSVKGLLQVVSPSNRVERVVSTCPDSAPLSDCQGTISAIEEFCNPHSLQSVKIMDNMSYSWEPGDRLDVYPDPREMDLDISGLSKFTNLQELVVLWEKSVRLSPREIGLIPTWWPRIRHLDLCQQYPSEGRTPAIDHTHLLELVRGCPLLRFLGLRFDTTGIPGEHQDHVETFRLEVLRVSGSPIVSPSRVAAFIRIHFPRLAKLDFKYNAVVEREPTLVDRRWAAVAEALTDHR
ncbi:hypothetical protein NMY22_g5563 [Coprinellus aureogranulatus]|nr:hypothetical protein NMY22_g5563 [Coprinellus aureogranulatus]